MVSADTYTFMKEQGMPVDLSIIVVNWNSKEYVERCIASIRANTAGIDYEVIVVDSGSFDGCGEMLERTYPEVRFIQSKLNLGFGRASNLGAEYARGSMLLFLNPDTEVMEGAIARVYGCMPELPEAGVVGCRLLNSDGSLQTSCVQSLPTILNQMLDADVLRHWFPRARLFGTAALFTGGAGASEVEAIAGAFMMVRQATFARVGGFSPDYFMYGEDLDLCLKMRDKGLRNYHVGDARVVHHGGGSSQHAVSRFATVMKVESVGRLLRKSRGRVYGGCYRLSLSGAAAMRLALLCLLFPARSVFCTKGGWSAVIWKWFLILRWGLGLEGWTTQYDLVESRATSSEIGGERPCVESAGS
jgi:GT2 family glycosyltransferase